MLEARSVAVVGRQRRAPAASAPGWSRGAARSSARVHLVNPRYDEDRRLACVPSLDALDEPPTWCCSASGDRAGRAAEGRGRGRCPLGRGVRHRARGRAARDRHRDRHRGRDGGVRRRLHGLRQRRDRACARWATSSAIPFPRAVSRWSPTRARCSPPCCAPGAGSASAWRCPPVRSWSPTPPTTSTTRSTSRDTRVIALLLETPRPGPGCGRRCAAPPSEDVPVVILPVGHSPLGRAMVAAHSGAVAGDAAGWAGVLRRHRRGPGHRPGRVGRHPGAFRAPGRAGRRAPRGDRDRPRLRRRARLCADLAHDLGVDFAELSPGTLAALGELLDEGLVAANPLDVWGTGADTQRPVRRLPACDGDGPGGRRDRAGRRPGAPSTTATPPTPTRCSTSPPDTSSPAGGARLGPVSGRSRDGTTAAGQRYSGARGHAQRAGRAGPPGSLATVRATHPRCRSTRSDGSAGGMLSPPGRWRRSSCSPTTASPSSHRGSRGCLDDALSAADRDRLSGRPENPGAAAQERRRRGGARTRRRRRVACGVRGMSAAAGAARQRGRDGAPGRGDVGRLRPR